MNTATKRGAMRLLVRGPNWLGDSVLATAVIRQIARQVPNGRLHVFARAHLAPIYRGLPATVHALPERRDFAGVLEASRAMRRVGAVAALLLAPSLRAALETTLAGIPKRVGYPDDHRGVLLTHSVSRARSKVTPRAPCGKHVLEEWLELADRLAEVVGGSREVSRRPEPAVVLLEDDERVAGEVVARARSHPSRPLVGVHPLSAGGVTRSWPMARFQAVLRRLSGEQAADLILLGGPEAGPQLETMAAAAGVPVTVVAGRGALSLHGLAGLLRRLTVLLTNDSGPMHLAAAVGTPVVALFGATHPALTGPVGTGHVLVHRGDLACAGCYRRRCPMERQCLTRISVDEVVRAVYGVVASRAGMPARRTDDVPLPSASASPTCPERPQP